MAAIRIYRTILGAFLLQVQLAAGACLKPEPPADLKASIDWVWNNRIKPTVQANNKNTAFDIILAGKGDLKFCVRWDSDEKVSGAQRELFESLLQRQMDKWTSTWLKGYDCWPYDTVPVKVTGWAVRNRATLDWTNSDSPLPITVNNIRENAPQCPEECGRFFHQQAGYEYPNCKNGFAGHYDMSLWGTKGFSGGAGSDWGQRLASDYLLQGLKTADLTILEHEMGHGFFLPDFYETPDFPPGGLPRAIMQAGAAQKVEPWDGWMLRRVWSELKSQSGRFPVGIRPLEGAADKQFILSSGQGEVRIRSATGSDQSLHVRAYDLSGRLLQSWHFPHGLGVAISLGKVTGFPRGVQMIAIDGGNRQEVHRVNILY